MQMASFAMLTDTRRHFHLSRIWIWHQYLFLKKKKEKKTSNIFPYFHGKMFPQSTAEIVGGLRQQHSVCVCAQCVDVNIDHSNVGMLHTHVHSFFQRDEAVKMSLHFHFKASSCFIYLLLSVCMWTKTLRVCPTSTPCLFQSRFLFSFFFFIPSSDVLNILSPAGRGGVGLQQGRRFTEVQTGGGWWKWDI